MNHDSEVEGCKTKTTGGKMLQRCLELKGTMKSNSSDSFINSGSDGYICAILNI